MHYHNTILGQMLQMFSRYEFQAKIQYIIDNPYLFGIFKENIPRIKSIEDNAKEMEEIYGDLIAGRCYENKNLKYKNHSQIN